MTMFNARNILFASLTATFLISTISHIALVSNKYKMIPQVRTEQVEPGYVSTSDLEVMAEDLLNDGKQELVFNVKGTPYVMRYNNQGEAELSRYDIIPAKIQIQKPKAEIALPNYHGVIK
jgi:hypothetical protein